MARRRHAGWGRATNRLILRATTVGAWIADGLCLYFALRATGTTIGLDVLFLAYSIGVLTSLVPLLPAGIGLVETVTPLILHVYGVPLPTALAAVLAYRLLATVLPAVLGLFALAGLRVGPKPARSGTTYGALRSEARARGSRAPWAARGPDPG